MYVAFDNYQGFPDLNYIGYNKYYCLVRGIVQEQSLIIVYMNMHQF